MAAESNERAEQEVKASPQPPLPAFLYRTEPAHAAAPIARRSAPTVSTRCRTPIISANE